MRKITAICFLFLGFSVLHNIYLFNTEDEDGEEDWNSFGDDGNTGGLMSRFLSSSIRRVKRRIFYRNESLPEVDTAVFGNRTGRNNTISLIKLLNKNYYIIKKRYYEILANKSLKVPPMKFHGREYLAKLKAEQAAAKKPAASPSDPGVSPAPPPAAGAPAVAPAVAPAGGTEAPAGGVPAN